jgi:drug/metabolite transporter (DMT)-like permease
VTIVFALTAAVLYGSADFLGGAVSRRTHVLSVLVVSAPAGAVVLLAVAMAAGGRVGTAGLPWAAAAGVAGGAGLILFYAGLAAGPMQVVAPVSALVSTVLPVGVAIAAGERPGPLVYLGGAVCLVATVLVSSEGIGRGRPATRPGGRGLLLGIAGGLAFGLFFLFLRYAGASGVLWPSAVARITGALVVTGAVAWLGGQAWRSVSPWLLAAAIVSGVLDAAANVCYVAATRDGLFGIAVVLTSLYPGITVLLARVVLRERMRLPQVAGLLLAVAGIALVSI